MYPPQFDYHRAETVDEALALLETHADRDPRILAGGHALLPEMKNGRASPETLVDIGDVVELAGIEVGNDETVVGALTTYADVVGSDPLWDRATVLAEAAGEVGDVQIRNRGTIGGNLAQADPGGDLPAAAVAADATVLMRGADGERAIPAEEFFVGENATALGADEIVTGVRVPHATEAGGAYAKKTHPASGYAMVGVAAAVTVDDGEVTDARVAANGATNVPIRLTAVEEALVGDAVDSGAVKAAADRVGDGLDPTDLRSDVYASGEFRAQLLAAYAERALETAVDRATGAGGNDDTTGDAGGDRR